MGPVLRFLPPLICLPPPLAQRFPNLQGASWRRWSSEWSGTMWLRPRPRPRVISGRHACTNALSRCVEVQ